MGKAYSLWWKSKLIDISNGEKLVNMNEQERWCVDLCKAESKCTSTESNKKDI